MENNTNNETDRIAVIAGACAIAFWIYDQVKIEIGVNLSMLICAIFITLSLCYIMATGLALKTRILTGEKSRVIGLIEKIQRALYSMTTKFFWYALLYIIMFFVIRILNIPISLEQTIAWYIDMIFIINIITFMFKTPRTKVEEFLLYIDKKLTKAPNDNSPKTKPDPTE